MWEKHEERNKVIARVVISLIVVGIIYYYSDGEMSLPIMLVIWPFIYALVSTYYHIRRFIRNDIESGEFIPDNGLLNMLFGYIICPLLCIFLEFGVLPELISKIFPETWRENVQVVLIIGALLGVIIYDIYQVKVECGFNKRTAEINVQGTEEM